MNLNGNYAITREAASNLFTLSDQLQAVANHKPSSAPTSSQVNNYTAIINVTGVIFPKANILTIFGFGVAIDALAEQLTVAENDPAVKKIVFNFDSPGGDITGVNEFSNQISAAKKPTVAYVSGTGCSAAYWLAAACQEIVVDATSVLGSIGVVSVMRAPNGNTIEIVSSNASDKRPDPTTDAGKDTIRATLNELEAVFHQSVSAHRPKLTVTAMKALRGGVKVGANAVSAGLADRVGNMTAIIYGLQIPNRSASTNQTAAADQTMTDDQNGWGKAFKKATNPMDHSVHLGSSLKVVIGGFKEPSSALPAAITQDSEQATANKNGWTAAFKKAANQLN